MPGIEPASSEVQRRIKYGMLNHYNTWNLLLALLLPYDAINCQHPAEYALGQTTWLVSLIPPY